jgi:hypothetical protein
VALGEAAASSSGHVWQGVFACSLCKRTITCRPCAAILNAGRRNLLHEYSWLRRALMASMLDDLLPLLASSHDEVHVNVALLEVNDVHQLVELAANPKLRRYLLARLSDTVALIDPGQVDALAKALLADGQTPKMVKGISS